VNGYRQFHLAKRFGLLEYDNLNASAVKGICGGQDHECPAPMMAARKRLA
jgi:hypothetical protein